MTIEFHKTNLNPLRESYVVKNYGMVVFEALNHGCNPTDHLRTICECLRWITWNTSERLVNFNGRKIQL